jgi:hypothetical protein
MPPSQEARRRFPNATLWAWVLADRHTGPIPTTSRRFGPEGLLPEVEVTVPFGYFSNDHGRFSRVKAGFARTLYEDYAESSRVRRDLAPAGLTASKLAPIHWL